MRALWFGLAVLMIGCGGSRGSTSDSAATARQPIPWVTAAPPGAMNASTAMGQPNRTWVVMVAQLVKHRPTCPPCPQGADCAQCEAQVPWFGDGQAARFPIEVLAEPDDLNLPDLSQLRQVPLGTSFVLEGQWREGQYWGPGIDRIFLVRRIAQLTGPAPPPGQPMR